MTSDGADLSKTPLCFLSMDTPKGHFRFFEQVKKKADAIMYCKNMGAQLAHFGDMNFLEMFSRHMHDCHFDESIKKTVFRKYHYWHVGLQLEFGHGNWENGVPFNYLYDGRFFNHKMPDVTHSCDDIVFFPAGKELVAIPCGSEKKFICQFDKAPSFWFHLGVYQIFSMFVMSALIITLVVIIVCLCNKQKLSWVMSRLKRCFNCKKKGGVKKDVVRKQNKKEASVDKEQENNIEDEPFSHQRANTDIEKKNRRKKSNKTFAKEAAVGEEQEQVHIEYKPFSY